MAGRKLIAIVKSEEFRGEVGTAIYINDGLDIITSRSENLRRELKRLQDIGYEVRFE